MKNKITINDVAERAGVCIGTVSRTINGYKVAQDLKDKVNKAILEMDYSPNAFAQGIRSERKNNIGIIVIDEMEHDDPWLSKILLSIIKSASNAKYRTMLKFWKKGEPLPDILKFVDLCILIGHYPKSFYKIIESQYKTPLIGIAEDMSYEPGCVVNIDFYNGMKKAVEYLAANGHREIALVIGDLAIPNLKDRYNGYFDTIVEFGCLQNDHMVKNIHGVYNPIDGYHATIELLKQTPAPTAIIYHSDYMAIGGMEAIKGKGLKIPDDVSIIGFDDTKWGQISFPMLTTVAPDYNELAETLIGNAKMLIDKSKIRKPINIEMKLIKRDTVSRARRNG